MMGNPIRLLLTIPNFDTAGSGKVLLQLAERLDRAQFEPNICCTHERGAFFEHVRKSGIPIHIREFTSPMNRRGEGLLGCWRISRFFKQFDLIHSFHYLDDYSEGLAARMAGTKWIYVKKNMSWGGNGWRLRTRLAHGIVAQNSDMMRLFFPRNRNAVLIPFGVDTTEFSPRPRSAALCSEFGLTDKDRVVLTVANLTPVKGIECLIQAFNSIAGKHPTAWLFVVGDDRSSYATELGRQAAAGPAASRIVFTGKRLEVKDFHSIADVFVQPSLSTGEGSPLSLLEAMASGTLALASNVAGIRDQLVELPEQLFEAGDIAALTKKLTWVLGLPAEESRKVVQKQHDIVRERYAIEREVSAHESFYKKVMG